jgi:hypothetical protein
MFTFTILFVSVERCQSSYQLTCIAVRNMQQQKDAVQTEGYQNQANESFVNKTLDDLDRVRFSNRNHTQGKIKPTPQTDASFDVESGYYRGVFILALRPNSGQGLLMYEVSRSHTMTHHSR